MVPEDNPHGKVHDLRPRGYRLKRLSWSLITLVQSPAILWPRTWNGGREDTLGLGCVPRVKRISLPTQVGQVLGPSIGRLADWPRLAFVIVFENFDRLTKIRLSK